MISSLRGKLLYSDNQYAVIECGGVGFKFHASLRTLSRLSTVGAEVFVYTYMSVREDSIDLYGFISSDELECFKLVTSVNGLGSKMAIALLSEFTPDQISFFIISNSFFLCC